MTETWKVTIVVMVVSVYGSHHYKNILHQQWQWCKYAGCPLLTHSANYQRPAPLERGLFCIPTYISYKYIRHAMQCPAICSVQFVEAALYFAKYLLCGYDHYKLFICFARPAISVWGVSSLCDTRPRPSQFILKSLIDSRRLDLSKSSINSRLGLLSDFLFVQCYVVF